MGGKEGMHPCEEVVDFPKLFRTSTQLARLFSHLYL